MIIFEDSNISPERSADENLRLLKGSLGDMTDKLNMLSEQVQEIRNKLEREGE